MMKTWNYYLKSMKTYLGLSLWQKQMYYLNDIFNYYIYVLRACIVMLYLWMYVHFYFQIWLKTLTRHQKEKETRDQEFTLVHFSFIFVCAALAVFKQSCVISDTPLYSISPCNKISWQRKMSLYSVELYNLLCKWTLSSPFKLCYRVKIK